MESYLVNNLSGDNLLRFLVMILVVCWGYNLVSTARQNARSEKIRSREPFARIDSSMNEIRSKCDIHMHDINNRVDALERRMNEYDKDMKDLHNGQAYLCRGVQALLDNARHNGTEDEMLEASNGRNKWLRTRYSE